MSSTASFKRSMFVVALGLFAVSGCNCETTQPGKAPAFVEQPASLTVNEGSAAQFSASVDQANATWQWRRNGTPIAGATAATLSLPSAQKADDGARFDVVATTSGGSATSTEATLTVRSPPVITTQPVSVTVAVGATATFTAAATGAGLTWQWQRQGVAIPGATAASYTTPVTTPADDAATFRVVVSNAAGSVTSDAATLTVISLPVITTQPTPQTVVAGTSATFTVVATGVGLRYQWQRNGFDLSEATGATHTTPAALPTDDGAVFRVTVRNAAGSVQSDAASLTVIPPLAPARVTPAVVGFESGALALKADGSVWAWGVGSAGQLGQGTTQSSLSPLPVLAPTGNGRLDRVVKISAGPTHALVLRDDGTVWTWGTTWALGASASGAQTAPRPVQVAGVGGVGVLEHVVDVAAGDGVNAVVLTDGTVLTWGDNRRGALGFGTASGQSFTPVEAFFPTPVPGVTGVVQVSAGVQRVLARMLSGTVLSWGSNPNGELGRVSADTATPGAVGGISSAVRVAAGPQLSLAILSDGTARIFGLTGYTGTTGTGTGAECSTSAQTSPLTVARPAGPGSTFTSVAAAVGVGLLIHDGLLRQTGALLSDAATDACTRGLEVLASPAALVGVSRTFGEFTHVWTADGRVYGLNRNGHGELGVGDTDFVPGPRELAGFNLLGAPPATIWSFFTDFDTTLVTEVTPGPDAQRVPVQSFASLGPTGSTFGGQFLRSATGNVVTVTLTGLPAHSSVNLEFLFAAIDSLDGAGTFPAGDFFRMTLDGVTFFRESFANAVSSQVQTYLPPPGVELARHVDLGFGGPGSYYTDSAYDFGADPRFKAMPHTAETLVFTFQIEGAGIQALADESWAMDNLRISLNP